MLTRMARMLTRMARMLTRMTRMARMLTCMTRWLAGSHIIHTQGYRQIFSEILETKKLFQFLD